MPQMLSSSMIPRPTATLRALWVLRACALSAMQRGPSFKLRKMEIFTAFEQLNGMPVAATIGSFDGVHRGHVAMIAEARSLAKKRGLPLVVVTFARHPRLLFSGCNMPFLLSSNDEKIALIVID